jgi:hypothetical protein
MHMKRVLLGDVAAAAVALGIVAPTAGVAHADYVKCHVGGGGELWCEDMDTGQSWEQEPGGSYPAPRPSYCGSPYISSQLCN